VLLFIITVLKSDGVLSGHEASIGMNLF